MRFLLDVFDEAGDIRPRRPARDENWRRTPAGSGLLLPFFAERQQWNTVHLGFWVMAKPVNTNQGSIVIDSKVGHGTQSMVVWGDKGVEELL
ncbi:MAG: hypothetical protein WBB55_05110 [Anaerolineales bacterium]